MKKIVLSALIATSLVVVSEASDKLVTHTEFGFIDTQGNTRTQTFNLDAKAKKGWEKHIFAFSFDAQYATSEEIETKNKYVAELNYNYDFTEKFSFGYIAGFKQDQFSGYTYQIYTGPGAKYKVLITEAHDISTEANILYSEDSIDGLEDVERYAAYRVKGLYAWKIADSLKFDQELSYRANFEDDHGFFAYSKSAFTSKLSDIFSAGLSYKIDYSNLPVAGKEYTDRTFTANLIMDY